MSSSPYGGPARTGTSIGTDDPAPDEPQFDTTPSSTRRALITSAVDSIQRFKQGWKSIMFLKAGVGLGQVSRPCYSEKSALIHEQVIALVVLLVLASTLPSPLYPDLKQSEGSEACPNPALLQAWMIVQIFRLTICWSVSCWVAVRAQRALRRDRSSDDPEEPRVARFVLPILDRQLTY